VRVTQKHKAGGGRKGGRGRRGERVLARFIQTCISVKILMLFSYFLTYSKAEMEFLKKLISVEIRAEMSNFTLS
jgi:hypothetical protein